MFRLNSFLTIISGNFTLSFDSGTNDRKTNDIQSKYQIDLGSAKNINSSNYIVLNNQTAARIRVPNKANIVAVFDNLNVWKYLVDVDGNRYSKDNVDFDYASNDYVDQYWDLELFYKEYVGEELLNPSISYTDMKNKYPVQAIYLRFLIDHVTPKEIQLFEDYRGATNTARLFMISIRHRKIKMISDGNEKLKLLLLEMTLTNLNESMRKFSLENYSMHESEF